MRLLLLILMFALLPLRSWALGGMPVEMHATPIAATKIIAAQAKPVALEHQIVQNINPAHHECHSPVQTTPGDPNFQLTDHSAPSVPCLSCDDCALCHTLAAMTEPDLSGPPLPPHGLRPTSRDHFDSALSALSLKPPIT